MNIEKPTKPEIQDFDEDLGTISYSEQNEEALLELI